MHSTSPHDLLLINDDYTSCSWLKTTKSSFKVEAIYTVHAMVKAGLQEGRSAPGQKVA
jgi:hypothetical protein